MSDSKAPVGQKTTAGPDADESRAAIREFHDLPIRVAIELGRRPIRVADLLDLEPGAVIGLDKLTGEPVDVVIGDEPIARAEIVVSDETLVARISQILGGGEGAA
jgi:flagellar motor switch protein FliN/FliY